MNEFLRLISLADPNTRTVLLGTVVLGAGAAVVGSLAVLRRRALLGDCVAHASLPGICVAFAIFGERSLLLMSAGAVVFGLLAVGAIALVRALTRAKEDAAIAISLASFFGLGIVLLSILQRQGAGNRAGLDRFLFGQAATMLKQDVLTIAAVMLASLLCIAILFKEFAALCFDREFSASLGRRVGLLDGLLMAMIVVCTVVGLPAAGVVLMAALLIIPAVAARLWVNRLGPMLLLAGTFGAIAAGVGTLLSAGLPAPGRAGAGWPTGPAITLVAACLFVVSLLFAPGRGLVAAALRSAKLRRDLASRGGLHGPLDPRRNPTATTSAPATGVGA